MAERLTEQKTTKGITKIVIKPFVDMYIVVHKLYLLENIMEKYGVESVEELDEKIGQYIDKIDLEAENDYLKKAIEKQNIVTQSISKDRDTWKKACELACDVILRFTDGCPCKADYFYQQAKNMEGNDE